MNLNSKKAADFHNGKFGVNFRKGVDSIEQLRTLLGINHLDGRNGIYYNLNGMVCTSYERPGTPTVPLSFFFDKESIKVRIETAVQGSWYAPYVGKTLEVQKCEDGKHYQWCDDPELYIYKEHCEVIEPENESDSVFTEYGRLACSIIASNMVKELIKLRQEPKPNFAEGGPTSWVHESGEEQILNRTNRNTDSIDALKYSLNNMKTEFREPYQQNPFGRFSIGKHNSVIVTDKKIQNTNFPSPPNKPESEEIDKEHYGGYLVCESVGSKELAEFIVKACNAYKSSGPQELFDMILMPKKTYESTNVGCYMHKQFTQAHLVEFAEQMIEHFNSCEVKLIPKAYVEVFIKHLNQKTK